MRAHLYTAVYRYIRPLPPLPPSAYRGATEGPGPPSYVGSSESCVGGGGGDTAFSTRLGLAMSTAQHRMPEEAQKQGARLLPEAGEGGRGHPQRRQGTPVCTPDTNAVFLSVQVHRQKDNPEVLTFRGGGGSQRQKGQPVYTLGTTASTGFKSRQTCPGAEQNRVDGTRTPRRWHPTPSGGMHTPAATRTPAPWLPPK